MVQIQMAIKKWKKRKLKKSVSTMVINFFNTVLFHQWDIIRKKRKTKNYMLLEIKKKNS